MADRIDAGQLVQKTLAFLQSAPAPALFAVSALAAVATLFDIYGSERVGIIPLGIGSLIAQSEVTRNLLGRLGYEDVRRRYAALFAVGLVTGIATGVGFVLLILPGLYLAARWSISGVALLGENAGVFEAIGISWERTRPHALAIALALILVFVPTIGLGTVLSYYLASTAPIIGTALVNLCIYGASVLVWYLAVVIHNELQPKESFEQIFA
jgi:hypothetical protein